MTKIKILIENNEPIHVVVCPIIKNGNKFLIIKRKLPPLVYAGIAGHVNEGESIDDAVIRKVKGETGLDTISKKEIFSDLVGFPPPCRIDGVLRHKIYIYEVAVTGDLMISEVDAESYGWYTMEEIRKLELEKVWKYIFDKI